MDEKPLNVRVAEALGYVVRRSEGSRVEPAGWWRRLQPGDWHMPNPTIRHRVGDDLGHPKWCAEGCWALGTPRYDTDWSATGPLLVRYIISVLRTGPTWDRRVDGPSDWEGHEWAACTGLRNFYLLAEDGFGVDDQAENVAYGPEPLIAVCNLLITLHAAGKLKVA